MSLHSPGHRAKFDQNSHPRLLSSTIRLTGRYLRTKMGNFFDPSEHPHNIFSIVHLWGEKINTLWHATISGTTGLGHTVQPERKPRQQSLGMNGVCLGNWQFTPPMLDDLSIAEARYRMVPRFRLPWVPLVQASLAHQDLTLSVPAKKCGLNCYKFYID
jgi:hypothetical protein